MREIKFRAWDKKNKSMHDYGMSIRLGGGFDYDSFYWNERPDIILMQYTGLKDKNGNEIYEGDIIEFYYMGWHVAAVEYINCGFYVKTNGHTEDVKTNLKLDFPFKDREIIGNIYENPELWK